MRRSIARSHSIGIPVRIHVWRQACEATQHEGLVQGARPRRHRELPVARFAAYLGLVARAERNAALCSAGTRGLGDREDGAALCGYAHFAALLRVTSRCMPATWKVMTQTQLRHDNRISAAQRFQHVEKQYRRRGVQADTRIFRPRVECGSKLLILRCSVILHVTVWSRPHSSRHT